MSVTSQHTKEKRMVHSNISFRESIQRFTIPEELVINPFLLADEKAEVYRIALGRADLTSEELAAYKPMFDALDTVSSGFINNFCVKVNGKHLTFDLANITRTESKYGRFYDIEAEISYVSYGDVLEGIVRRKGKNATVTNKEI